MPPKKDQLSPIDLRQKAHDHGIRLQGPAPPSDWPDEHKRNFGLIRELQFLRYDDYKGIQRIPSTRRVEYQKRVRDLRIKVRDLLNDVNPNESSWQQLEGPIFGKFDGPVICDNCHSELSKSDFEAYCFNTGCQIDLDAKRRSRRACTCDGRRSGEQMADHDEEHGSIFSSVKGELITHVSGDDLDSSRISMRPDTVIGLQPPTSTAWNDTHFPVKGRTKLFLPFLVIEAKREKDAPGFRSIQYQTAFPVRRFLKAQADIDSRNSASEPCLVWFFAYQGDQWRLHAGTLDHGKVRIYDLWQGTIQSQDGALQLLLIVDYIWSWARDVYRIAIRELIAHSISSFRDVSPVSTDRFRHSVSLCPTSNSGSAPTSQDADAVLLDTSQEDLCQRPQSRHAVAPLKANTHPFLRWAVGHRNSPSWTTFGSIRHANIVQLDFHCHNYSHLSDPDPSFKATAEPHSIIISTEQLYDIATMWGSRAQPAWGIGQARCLRVTLFFQTYCDENSWQIRRVLNCVIWEANKAPIFTQFDPADLIIALLQVRNIHGRDSVWLALRCAGLLLGPKREERGLHWYQFTDTPLPESTFDILRGLSAGAKQDHMVAHGVSLDNELFWTSSVSADTHQSRAIPWEQDTKTGDCLIAIRSSLWSDATPRFCMFVLAETDYESGNELVRLLENAVSTNNFYADDSCQWSDRDTQTLQQWRKALVLERRSTV